MHRPLRYLAAVAVTLFVAACADVPTGAPGEGLQRVNASASVVPGTCTNLAQLNQLAAVLFTPQSSPNINSVRGKLKNLDGLVRKNKIALAEAQAGEIVAFTLKKHNQGGLAGTEADVKAFSNAVLCFAGIDVDVEEPTNSFFIMPSDTAQTVKDTSGTAGIRFPANPVFEPTLVTFEIVPDTFTAPGAGPLETKLDQYPGFVRITKQSETNAPLTSPVVVGVCANGAIPQEVRDRLRLGHGASAGFEITPPASADFLSCPNLTADASQPRWKSLVNAILPRQLLAQEFAGGGVGGTVTEFSPFAPVDPQLEFGGGVGGTVTEFTRMGLMQSALLTDGLALAVGACSSPIEGAMGSPVRDECRPNVRITTRLGTPFIGVPVTWNVTQGGGSVAANTGTCGGFGTSAATTTGPNGGAGICWTLGAVGANQVVATPSLGGDALDGVTFSPASTTFDAIANPAVGLVFTQQPPAVFQAGKGSAEVTAVDKNGERVHGYTGRIKLSLSQGTFLGGSSHYGLFATAGVASFSSIPVVQVGTGLWFRAESDFLTSPSILPLSTPFDVIPGTAWIITAEAGDGQTAAAGQPAPVDPRVRVTDRYGNAAPGVTVSWRREVSFGFVLLGTSVTGADGRTSIAWPLEAGTNHLRALLTEGSAAYVTFTATGTP